jgi:hypothetical protein
VALRIASRRLICDRRLIVLPLPLGLDPNSSTSRV